MKRSLGLFSAMLMIYHLVHAQIIQPNNRSNPIVEVHVGIAGRVEYLRAQIYPRHISHRRVDFPRTIAMNNHFQGLNPGPEDERGHLVASQFSGPPEAYNLVPQHRALNRNYKHSWVIADWYGLEDKIATHLRTGGNVIWTVRPKYGATNRPTAFEYELIFRDSVGTETQERFFGSQRNEKKAF